MAGNVICHAGRKCEVDMKINVMYISYLCPARGNATFGPVFEGSYKKSGEAYQDDVLKDDPP